MGFRRVRGRSSGILRTMRDTDVFICGGGPAGLAAAIACRLHGFDVIVADCAKPPIDKACGEGLLPDALEALRTLGVVLDPEHAGVFRGIRFTDTQHSVFAGRISSRHSSKERPLWAQTSGGIPRFSR